jgi:hypothetical protein
MKTDNFCFYLQNRLIQTSQTGGQWYSDTSPLSIPWLGRHEKGLLLGHRNVFTTLYFLRNLRRASLSYSVCPCQAFPPLQRVIV